MVNMVKYGIRTAVCGCGRGGRDGYRQVGCRQHKRRASLKIVGWIASVLSGTIWWRGLQRLGLRRGSFSCLVARQVCRRQHSIRPTLGDLRGLNIVARAI